MPETKEQFAEIVLQNVRDYLNGLITDTEFVNKTIAEVHSKWLPK